MALRTQNDLRNDMLQITRNILFEIKTHPFCKEKETLSILLHALLFINAGKYCWSKIFKQSSFLLKCYRWSSSKWHLKAHKWKQVCHNTFVTHYTFSASKRHLQYFVSQYTNQIITKFHFNSLPCIHIWD